MNDLRVSLAIAAALLVLAVFSGWRGARPYDPAKGPRMVPWRGIMLLAATLLLVMVVRIAQQAGLTS